jgi:hypothetical protein
MSSRFGVYYVRRTNIEPDQNFLDTFVLAQMLDTPFGAFVCVKYEPDSPPFPVAQKYVGLAYARAIGETIYIGVQANVGFFHYEHCQEGALLRRLAYNYDAGWILVEGSPQDWEPQILFAEDKLHDALACFDADMHDLIRKIWARKQVQQGDQFPGVDPETLYGELRRYYRLP